MRRIHVPIILFTSAALPLAAAAALPSPARQARATARQGTATSQAAPTPAQVRFERSADPADYVGSDTCAVCHDAEGRSHNAGPHWQTSLAKSKGPGWKGCESCHGPGKAHVDGGGDKARIISFSAISKREGSRICLDCHRFSDEHGNFTRSAHAVNDIGCTDCHSVHQPATKQRLLKAAQPRLCYGCHQDVRGDFNRPSHHRVNEGLVACTSCHSPHDGTRPRQLRAAAAQDAVCVTCHTDKQGPFTFEHAPVKTEGCVACHNPHGSANPRMLNRSTVNLLCLECHTLTVNSIARVPPAFHNQAQKYQACTLCHVAIHGSNSDRRFLRF